ncbi:MAG: acetoacetate--CoA ligase [Nitriliruptoraceae bacterium]
MTTEATPPKPLWEPADDAWETTRLGRFLTAMASEHGFTPRDYQAAWKWSVDDLAGFWSALIDEFDVIFHAPPSQILADDSMPGAVWLPDARLNYAEHLLRRRDNHLAVIARSQTRDEVRLTYAELAEQVARAAQGLRRLGIEKGDVVGAYSPNIPETLVVLLACASIGATFSSCAPEFGVRSVVDRFRQIEPSALLVIDGYRYGAKSVDRAEEVASIREALPTLKATVVVGYLDPTTAHERIPDAVAWDDLVADAAPLAFEPVAFDHPLYVLYSSGTTGLPKAIVHGHGGILLEHFKSLALQHDLGADDRFCWFTTTGWMMWNLLVSALAVETTLVLFDGDPGYPDLTTLWRLAEDTELTALGVGAPFVMNCRRSELSPGQEFDLSRLRQLGVTGSPLPEEGFVWAHQAVGHHVQIASVSGGTDVCTGFVGVAPVVSVWAGELSCRYLGVKAEAFDPQGRAVIGERGELVITAPMPSMPVRFWGDDDGSAYRAAYFEEFPGVWRHGDWIEITERGSSIITGRSDATLNRAGVRMGTAEFYSVVEAIDGVVDSLVVHRQGVGADGGADIDGSGQLVLFLVLDKGVTLNDELTQHVAAALRSQLSPRHVPDHIHQVPAVPRTVSGKKMEIPVKRLLDGEERTKVANPGAMANPEALDAYTALIDALNA